MHQDLETFVAGHLADPAIAWSLGSFGAIAEFMWRREEEGTMAIKPPSRVMPKGAIRVDGLAGARAVAYTTPSREPARRQSGIAICLSREACAMARRDVVTELGPDHAALRDVDRDAILFDMGLGQLQVDVMVRSSDPETIATLRGAAGRSIFDPSQTLMREMPRLSPHRVFASRCGRIEVYEAIPPADGRSPDGPHTHVLPKLLKANRTHAATIDLLPDLIPCLILHFSRPDPDHALDMKDDRHEDA